MPDAQDPRDETGAQPRRRSWIRRPGRWQITLVSAILVATCITVASALFTDLFPPESVTSCTVQDYSDSPARRSVAVARLHTDCGSFRSKKQVACTTDPTQEVTLVRGITYDFVVRGPRIPLLTAPKVVSATVSAAQPFAAPWEPRVVDPDLPESVQELQRRFSVEALRAFDYEQPPFDPSCDPSRMIMTAEGLQIMSLVDGANVLIPPAGVVPREPKLPCEGFWCTADG